MSFTKECRQAADEIWEASFQHPFVRELGEGTLSLERFRFYVMQDAYYLSHFARVQSFGAAKAHDMETTSRLAAHAQSTAEAELSLHKKFSQLLGITDAEKAAFQPAPTAYAYTSHMYRAACLGGLGEIIAALLPCYWLYYEIGERLKDCKPEEPIYQEWISAYGGDWFRTLVEEQLARVDELAEKCTEEQRNHMKELFITSSRYELQFWEMAYQLETWQEKSGGDRHHPNYVDLCQEESVR